MGKPNNFFQDYMYEPQLTWSINYGFKVALITFNKHNKKLIPVLEREQRKGRSFQSFKKYDKMININNTELIKNLDGKFGIILVSTGAANWEEIKKLEKIVNNSKLVLMHCVSAYPCKPENTNLPRINDLKSISERVGYSGHLPEVYDAILALEFDIDYLEKHFTIDKTLPGRDNQFALLPSELKIICEYRDRYKDMKISQIKDFMPNITMENIKEHILKILQFEF